MDVYYGIDTNRQIDMAVKMDKSKKKKSPTKNEAIILTKLKGIERIPTYFDYFYENKKNIIIEDLIGPSLNKLLSYFDKEYDLTTVAILGIQIISILKKFMKDLLFTMISNLAISPGLNLIQENLWKQENFSLQILDIQKKIQQKKFHNGINGVKKTEQIHYQNKIDNHLQCTPQYMSISVAQGYTPSRRTDLEELIYTMIFFFKISSLVKYNR